MNKFKKPSEAKSNSKVSFVNLSTYNSPEIVENKNKEWVEFGSENNYFGSTSRYAAHAGDYARRLPTRCASGRGTLFTGIYHRMHMKTCDVIYARTN